MTTPPDPTWIDYAREFQTLIVGLLGFGGIILTIRSQGRQTRLSHDYEKKQSAESVRMALEAEVEMLASMLEASADDAETKIPEEGKVSAVPAEPRNFVYKALLNKVDLLSPNDVARFARAHAYYEQYFTRLQFIGNPSQRFPGHIEVPANSYCLLIDLERNTANWMRNPPDQ